MLRWRGLLVVACAITAALDARADVCESRSKFTVDRNTSTEVVLLYKDDFILLPTLERNYRFILEGRAAQNDIGCDFHLSYQLYCPDFGDGAVNITEWRTISRAHKGGMNQCMWDVSFKLNDLDKIERPPTCRLMSVKHKVEATVRNKGKLQVVDVDYGIKGCGKP